MKHGKVVTILVLLIAILAIFATSYAIFSTGGDGGSTYRSIRGETVSIYGKGLYKHMSSEVAIQGIAQDYVTLFIGVPCLLVGLYLGVKGSIRGLFVLAGSLGYFLLTYLFYTAMAMYNELFLVYAALLACSFFAFILTLLSFDFPRLENTYTSRKTIHATGIFLVVNCSLIALLWLGSIIPPLLDGTLYPEGLQHYTTLIVQGFDLGLFLPIGFVSGILAIRRNALGYLFATIYVLFLCLLMSALTAKVLFMARAGYPVIPVIFIMPTILLVALLFSAALLKSLHQSEQTTA